MAQHLITPEAFSYEEILAELTRLLEEKYADTDGAWRDFYAFGTGQIILELLAGLGAFTTYTAVANRREAYLAQTALESSARAIAGPLGYSAFRGSNTTLRVSMYVNALTTVSKFDKLGAYEDDTGSYDLLSLDESTFSPPSSGNSLPNEVDLVIGRLAAVRLIMPSQRAQVFRFTQEGISDHFYLRVNGKIVPHSEDVLDLIHGKYVAVTNAHGSLDIMGINTYLAPEHQFRAGYELEVVYIDLHEVSRPQLSNVELDVGTVENVTVGQRFLEPDTVDEIQVKAPLRHETGRVVRGRNDYMKMVREHLPNVIDVAAKDMDAANIQVSYLIESEDRLTDAELEVLMANIANHESRPMGVMPPSLTAGRRVQIRLGVQVVLRDTSLPTASVQDDVIRAISTFELKLGKRVDLYDLEDVIRTNLAYAKAIRVSLMVDPDLSEEEAADWKPLKIQWDEYYEFQPTVTLLTAADFYSETAGPVQSS